MTKIRVLGMTDHPVLHSGFGTVGNQIYKGFHDAGFELTVIGTLSDGTVQHDLPYEIIQTCDHDPSGLSTLDRMLVKLKPDVFFTLADPGTNHYRVARIAQTMQPVAIVAYFPIEGEPISGKYLNFIKTVKDSGGEAITYTQWGSNAVKHYSGGMLNIPHVHHGLDHAPWEQFDDPTRAHLRKLVGWDGKMVLHFRGRNKRVKNQLALLHAMRLLRDVDGIDDVVLYLHCKAFEGFMLDGYNLEEWQDLYRIDNVVFPPDLKRQLEGAPFRSSVERNWLSIKPPDNERAHLLMLAGMDIIERQNCCDVFIDPSQVEGWGLPLMEAAACGMPIVSVNDRGVRQEIAGDAAYWMEPESFTYWHTGAKLWIVNEHTVASTIKWFYRDWKANGDLLRYYSEVAMDRSRMYTWQPARDMFVEAVEKAAMNRGRSWLVGAKNEGRGEVGNE